MDTNGLSKLTERTQPSIKSFFQPRATTYTAPPSQRPTPPPSSPPHPAQTVPVDSEHPFQPNSSSPEPASQLPEQASISRVNLKHIQPLKRIFSLLLPINYPDAFYKKIVDPNNEPNFCRVMLWGDPPAKADSLAEPQVVGGIVCRLEQDEDKKDSAVYIQSIAVLSPFRRYGLATAALNSIIESICTETEISMTVSSIYAHVWTENTEGLEWYEGRGFAQEPQVARGYYSRLKPPDAWVLRRPILPSDHLEHHPRRSATNGNSAFLQPSISPKTAKTAPQLIHSSKPTLPSNGFRPQLNSTSRATSFQKSGPGHEWNDLPEDILKPSFSSSSLQPSSLLIPPGDGSAGSSRSSSRSRTGEGGKKKRQYPAAAFGAGGNA